MLDKPASVGATWFTNLSDIQVDAIQLLAFSIRDDGAEGTVYRTHLCLSRLGVTPMVKSRMLHKLINVCRGSDLAFLYFLLEACYKGAGFAYSERILMSAITFLDLEMTMRELDRILPPGVERLKKKSIAPPPVTKSISLPPSPNRRQSDFGKVRSPYFTSLPKPKVPHVGKKITAKRPHLVVTFPFWPAGERPNYKVNDESRWFATYKFQPVKRMLFKMVGDIMSDYWEKVSGTGSFIPEDETFPLCEFHKAALRKEQLVKDAAVVKAHKQCLALVEVNSRDDVALKKRIIAQLDKDIEDCTQRWKRLRDRHHTDVMLIEDHDQMCSMGKVPTTRQESKIKHLNLEADIGRLKTKPTMGVHLITSKATVSRLSRVRVSDPEDEIPCPLEEPEEKLTKCPPQLLGNKKRTRRVIMTQTKVGDERPPVTCKKPSLKPGRFFKSTRRHSPFVFHYHEIPPKDQDPAARDVMRSQAIRTLKEESCPSSEDGYNGRMHPREQVVTAIVECAQDMWFGSLEAYQRNQVSLKSEKLKNSDESVKSATTPICGLREDDGLEWTKQIKHFDPDNRNLMERLLKDGFDILRRDPRCVFAAFPNSHKSFVMQEWIKRRYGKTYSHEEIGRTVQKGINTFHRLERILSHAPSAKYDGYSADDTYADHKRLRALSEKIKEDYRMPLNDKILALTRTCWQAMRPHLVRGSTLLNSFFAYLPVRYADML
ncbi:uncharacterized protein LOC108088073 [Drosophila ficusphila]|uniref:uncharacterized protein LOC108088073 n=1 Tax=Drosophila ficusphila TaxID=30025 RepID=UPI0007E6A9ED|nr:uncharacterized protein LOC108088073 [Drosophila ficusphila]